jgi:hypothetical protein
MLHTACFTTNGNLPLEAMSKVQGWILKVDQTANSAPPPPSSDESGMMQPTASTRQTAVPPQRRFAAAAEAWCRVPPAALKCAQGRDYIYIKLQVQETGHVSLPTHVHSFVACGRTWVPHAPATYRSFTSAECATQPEAADQLLPCTSPHPRSSRKH